MFWYLLTFSVSSLFFYLASLKNKNISIYSLIALMLPSLLACFRDLSVGTDTEVYYLLYEEISSESFTNAIYNSYNVEISFILMSSIAKYFGGFPFVLFVYQFLTIYFIYSVAFKFRKRLPVWLVLFLYYCFFYNNSLNIMRQCLAASFIVYISAFLYEGWQKRYCVYFFISMLIHSSSIVGCICVYIINRFRNVAGKKIFWLMFIYIIALVIIFQIFKSIDSLLALIEFGKFSAYNNYLNSDDGVISSTDLTYRLIFLMMCIYATHMKIISNRLSLLYILLLFTDLFLLLLGFYSKWISRLAFYTSYYHIFFISFLSYSRRVTFNSRIFLQIIIALMGVIYWFYIFDYRGSTATIPYQFIDL